MKKVIYKHLGISFRSVHFSKPWYYDPCGTIATEVTETKYSHSSNICVFALFVFGLFVFALFVFGHKFVTCSGSTAATSAHAVNPISSMVNFQTQMHVAPRIVVQFCPLLEYAPDVVPDMPQMMLLSTADFVDCL